jgi:hypothetical protein
VPRLDISVITHDRPRSLTRLLSSLSAGRFFGDHVNVRINLEQSADVETLRIVHDFHWAHGDVFVHHRVVHGGLLPAVIESWYPHSNDSYSLLLEDDIELSPLFYAWAKMAILRYRYVPHKARPFPPFLLKSRRYGKDANESAQLFGVSLYQQKHLELKPEGRRPFDARALFAAHGLGEGTPYLSAVPCSWGAVYFPEHWRAFHAYLPPRLSDAAGAVVVAPDLRSNAWKRSWKRYFIEMVYLRGWVMLYPNYAGYASLSTNHLEAGAHVKQAASREKKALFVVPLMGLPGDTLGGVGLLDLPGGGLPAWGALPVLDLTGAITSLDALKRQGERRMVELTTCSRREAMDVGELVCNAPL